MRVNKRSLTFTINGVEYSGDTSNCRVTSAASSADFISFADAAAGGARQYTLSGTAVQDTGTASLWRIIFSQAGQTLDVVYRPQGNATPSVSQPHYHMSVVISEPDGDFLGGDADASTTAYQTLDFAFSTTAKPTEVTA